MLVSSLMQGSYPPGGSSSSSDSTYHPAPVIIDEKARIVIGSGINLIRGSGGDSRFCV